MIQYEYKEILMSKTVSLIDQINEQGRYGWRFVIQAQRISPNKFSIGGQPQTDIVIIFERQVQDAVVIDKDKN